MWPPCSSLWRKMDTSLADGIKASSKALHQKKKCDLMFALVTLSLCMSLLMVLTWGSPFELKRKPPTQRGDSWEIESPPTSSVGRVVSRRKPTARSPGSRYTCSVRQVVDRVMFLQQNPLVYVGSYCKRGLASRHPILKHNLWYVVVLPCHLRSLLQSKVLGTYFKNGIAGERDDTQHDKHIIAIGCSWRESLTKKPKVTKIVIVLSGLCEVLWQTIA